MRLINGKAGNIYRVIKMDSGREAYERIVSLGIVPDSILKIKRKAPLKGPIIVSVNGNDVVLGRGIASKIIVEEE